MEVQNKNNIRVILYVLVLIAVFSIIFLIFKIEISNEKLEKNKVGLVDENTILPTPDRIIYKNINNEYIIINSGTSAYTQIYSELYNRITNTIEGKVYLEDEISQMQNKGSFIEFDYNSKSKNYVFMLNEKEIGIIKRFSDSGQVIQTSLPDKDKLVKKIDTVAKDISTKYDFDTEYNLNSENKLSKVETNLNLSQTKVTGVYQKVIEYSEDGSTRVDTIVISAQHDEVDLDVLKKDIKKYVIDYVFKDITNTKIYINPTGRFVIGGPLGDSGLTGRKIIVDTYGGYAHHGGGAFSGKDPTKVDRSAAYMARCIAKNVVANGYAKECEIGLSYVIGYAKPISVNINTYGTNTISEEEILSKIEKNFPLTPKGIIEYLDLRKPIYKKTTNYGHFGKDGLPWEKVIKF